MIKKLLKYKIFGAVCIAAVMISFIAVGHWFSGDKILYFWDAYLPFDPEVSFKQLYYLWREGLFPGYSTPGWSWFLFWILFFAPYYLFHSLSISEMFVYVLLLSLSVINFYLLSEYILTLVFRDKARSSFLKLIAFVSAFVFTFNLYTFFNFYFMFNPGAFIVAMLPLNLLSLFHIYPLDKNVEVRNKGKWIFIFFASMIFMSPGFGIYVYFLQYLIWILIYLLFYLVFSCKKIFSFLTIEVIFFYVSLIILNLWWFIPSYLSIAASYSGQSSFGTTVWFDKGFTPLALLNSFRLLGTALMVGNNFSWTPLYLGNPLFTFPLFIFPFTLIISLVFLMKNKMPKILIFLLGVFLTSLFIVKFTNPPLSILLWFGFHYIPFFGAFRDSFQKAGIFYTLPFFIFMAIGTAFLIKEFWKGRTKILAVIFVAFFITGVIILSGPFFLMFKDNIREVHFSYNKEQYVFSAKTQVPPEYYSLKKYLEGKCVGETIMEIPRSGFVTDAVWKKYKSSYVGQDILVNLIDCNFLSTGMFDSAAEQTLEVPYILLERDDFPSFKNYLNQNRINYILVRHDFVPQGYVTWTYVNPNKIEKQLLSDGNFKPVFKNDFFTLFIKSNFKKNQYGFGLTKEAIYNPSKIQNVDDYTAVSQVIGNINNPVLLDSETSRFKNSSTSVVVSANCVGCFKIDPESMSQEASETLIQKIKNILKIFFRRPVNNSPAVDISLDILTAAKTFIKIEKSINNEDQKNLESLVDLYKKQWNDIERKMISFDSDIFSKNNKYIEASNFLTIQRNTIFDSLTTQVFRPNKFLNDPTNKRIFFDLVTFQKKMLTNFSKNISQTDLASHMFKFRLDVPHDDNFICRVVQRNKGATVSSVGIGNRELSRGEFSGKLLASLKKGSHSLTISYDLNKIMNRRNTVIKSEDFVPIELGSLDDGKYKVSFDLAPGLSGRMLIFITKGEIPSQVLLKADLSNNPDEDIKSLDTIGTNFDSSTTYTKEFDVQPQDAGKHVLYLYYFDLNVHNINVQNLQLESVVDNSFFRFVCTNRIKNEQSDISLSVKKINPTRYFITIPKNFNGFLTFNQSYDDNWIATFEGKNTPLPHIKSGYSNAWYIDKDYGNKILIEYKSQKTMVTGGIIALFLSLISILIYLIIIKLKK